jgi:hypothetical protein
MIDVQAPDGTIARFPDGMSDNDIAAVMRKNYPPIQQPQSAIQSQPIGSNQPDTSRFTTSTGQTIPSAADRAAAAPVVSPDSGAAQMMPSGVALGTEAENRNRAFTSGPLVDRAVAAGQTYLPPSMGGTGKDYASNLDEQRSAGSEAKAMYPGASTIGDVAGVLPYMAIPGIGALGASGGLGARMLGGAATGFGIGGLQGAAASPDWTDRGQTGSDALTGGAVGGAVGGIVPLASAIAGKVITPFEIPPERQALVNALKAADVNPTAGQVTGNRGLQKIEAGISDIPFAGGGAEAARVENNKAFTAAMMDKLAFLVRQMRVLPT